MKIKTYTHGEGDFWPLMGPFFASREVRKNLGIPMSSDEQHTWLVAVHQEAVVGFTAVEQQKNGCMLRHVYVVPESRHKGLMTKLVQHSVKFVKTSGYGSIRVTVPGELLDFYANSGWEETSTRGQYHNLRLDLEGT